MSVLTPPPDILATPASLGRDEQHLVLRAIDWETYIAIGEVFRDRPALRITYDRGTLEFMTTSPAHEKYKQWFGRILETLAEELQLRIEPAGNMTFQRRDLDRGLEPDQCYWIANEHRVRGRMEWLPDRDPPPDVVLEIEISRNALNRMGIYAALGCAEVWRFDGDTLRVVVLQADRTYQPVERSPSFPGIPLNDLVPFLQPNEQLDYLSRIQGFRTWVRQQLSAPT